MPCSIRTYLDGMLKKIDRFPVSLIERLNFEGKSQFRSVVGGLCTICAVATFVALCVIYGRPIYNNEKPFSKQSTFAAGGSIKLDPVSYANTTKLAFYFRNATGFQSWRPDVLNVYVVL